jgi:hypothetical protein
VARPTGARIRARLRLSAWDEAVVRMVGEHPGRLAGQDLAARGKHGKRFRSTVSGMPTRRFRDLLVGMAANYGLWIIAVEPAWTSVWGGRYWQFPLNESTRGSVTVSRHHAAAVVIGRRGLGHRARATGRVCPNPTSGWGRESCRLRRAAHGTRCGAGRIGGRA